MVIISCLAAVAWISFCQNTLAGEDAKPLWMVVGRAGLVEPIAPLAQWRRDEGFETLVSTAPIQEALAAAPRRPDFILLVGDDQPGRESAPWYLPARRVDAHRWSLRQPVQFASDVILADFDGDLMPDVPIGRIPARTPDEVAASVAKILAFERRQATLADLEMAIWTGSPQFGAVLESTATELLLSMLRQNAPRWASPRVVAGNPNSPHCAWPRDQAALFTRQVARGGVCNALMGHGSVDSFFSMYDAGKPVLYRAADAKGYFNADAPAPPMVFFCCLSGNFTAANPCLAESLFAMAGGPVATVAATTESHPLPNYFSGVALLMELGTPTERFGTLWLAAQRRSMKLRSFLVERLLLSVEGEIEKLDQTKLRHDGMLMYTLLGDPATRLKTPLPLTATVEKTADGWHWTAQRPAGAEQLSVGHRSAEVHEAEWVEAPANRPDALAAFESANAALDFTPLDAPADQSPWQGTATRPGRLRLATVAAGKLYVAVLTLE